MSAINLAKKPDPKYCYGGFYGLFPESSPPWGTPLSVPHNRVLSGMPYSHRSIRCARTRAHWVRYLPIRHLTDNNPPPPADPPARSLQLAQTALTTRQGGSIVSSLARVFFSAVTRGRTPKRLHLEGVAAKKKSRALNLSARDADRQKGPPDWLLRQKKSRALQRHLPHWGGGPKQGADGAEAVLPGRPAGQG